MWKKSFFVVFLSMLFFYMKKISTSSKSIEAPDEEYDFVISEIFI